MWNLHVECINFISYNEVQRELKQAIIRLEWQNYPVRERAKPNYSVHSTKERMHRSAQKHKGPEDDGKQLWWMIEGFFAW